MKVQNIYNENLSPVVEQFVITTSKGIYFQSYASVVAFIDTDGKITLSKFWDYSRTTTKYVLMFIRQYSNYEVSSAKEVREMIKEETFKVRDTESLAIR